MSTVSIIFLIILAVVQRIQLHAERQSHRQTRRALIWWRDERQGRHGHGGPLYYATVAGVTHAITKTGGDNNASD